MNKIVKIFLVGLTSILAISCSTTRIIPDKPVSGNLPTKQEHLNSSISLPFELDMSSIETLINERLPSGVINSGSGRDGNTKNYSYEVIRNSSVKFSAEGDELIFKVPILINARGSYTTCAGYWHHGRCHGGSHTEHGDASPTVDIELRIKLAIKEDYSIKAETYLKGNLSGDTHLHIDLIGNLIRINIDIKDKLEKPLKKFVDDYQQEIDRKTSEIVNKFKLRDKVSSYWESVKKPVKFDEFWLDVQPQEIIFENLNIQNKKLRLAVGVSAKLQVVGNQPSVSTKPLPNLTLRQKVAGAFNIYLPARVEFDKLETIIKNKIHDKKYEKKGVSVKVEDVQIQGVRLNNTSLLLINAKISGKAKFKKFKGDVYFTALPGLDDATKKVFISDFKLDPNTNSFLINNGLPFLIENFYYEEIKDNLQYSYQEDYKKNFNLINSKIKEFKFGNLTVNGELQKVEIPGFYLSENEIELLMIAKGLLKSKIDLK